MSSVNKWIGIGHLTADPESRAFANGDSVCNITVACNESWKSKDGEKKESVEFVRVVFFRKLAEIVAQYLKKGSQVYVEGALKTRKWADKDGIDRYTTEVIASEMRMLGGRSSEPESKPERASPQQAPSGGGVFDDMVDDLPF